MAAIASSTETGLFSSAALISSPIYAHPRMSKCDGTRPPATSRSEIRFIGLRDRIEILLEMVDAAVIGANVLLDRHIVPAPNLLERERRVEGVLVFHLHDGGQAFAVRTDREVFHDVELVGVRRAEIVDEVVLASRQPDRIHHQRVAVLVMADGFPEPGRFHVRRMLIGEKDVADETVALP